MTAIDFLGNANLVTFLGTSRFLDHAIFQTAVSNSGDLWLAAPCPHGHAMMGHAAAYRQHVPVLSRKKSSKVDDRERSICWTFAQDIDFLFALFRGIDQLVGPQASRPQICITTLVQTQEGHLVVKAVVILATYD